MTAAEPEQTQPQQTQPALVAVPPAVPGPVGRPVRPAMPVAAVTRIPQAAAPGQASLFGDERFVTIEHRGLTIDQAFLAFHEANPWVYRSIVALAREWIAADQKRNSIKAIFEWLRRDYGLKTRRSDFKLNNNFTSRYVRLIAQEDMELAATFETRRLRAA